MIKFNNTTAKSITAMAAAALLAGLAVLFASIVPEARAETQVEGALHPSFAKGDRSPAAETGAACSSALFSDHPSSPASYKLRTQ